MAANNWKSSIDNVKDFAALSEKPWRKPGADVSDYFNYGFNEDTWAVRQHTHTPIVPVRSARSLVSHGVWQMYCTKQEQLRAEGARDACISVRTTRTQSLDTLVW